ncbi:cysteine protease ATG4D [Malaya genurostris]|uniref:cysteine protease ATG4D n=1 Tax=Malaya genurostris TaxID=325434 RepID=UPI0026F38DAB|nr:cysteine protease ATG4D [Malaya genurostris]
MNYDVLLNRTGFGRLNVNQQIRSVSESEGQQSYRQQENETPTRKISESARINFDCHPGSARGTPIRSGCTSAVNSEELKGKVETKLMSMWNNVKFGWSGKMKPSFSKEQPLWLLGRCYHQKATPVLSMENSMELSTSVETNQLVFENVHQQQQGGDIFVESPPEETGTDAAEDSSPDAIVEEEGIEAFKRDFISRVWMTYRKEFQTIYESNYTSDCGWGCMIRSGQMLLAQGLITHFLGRAWRWDASAENLRLNYNTVSYEDTIHRKIIRWFGDTPSRTSPFSIHTLVALGKETGKKPGDWYGPGAVAHLLKQAVKQAAQEIADLDGVHVYVAQDCAVYIQDIIDECTISNTPSVAPWQKKIPSTSTAANYCSSTASSCMNQFNTTPNIPVDQSTIEDPILWKSLILLVPLRLGTDKLNPIYNDCLKAMLSLDNCIGIIGGRPKHSLFFVGYQEDKLIHLDPHFCQDMVDVNQENFAVSSFHCKSPRKIKLSKMDPSCCIGFYCETRKDFFKFVDNVKPFLLPAKQSMSSSFTSSTGLHQFNEITYPMFVFCRGKSSEQQIDLPSRPIYRSPPVPPPLTANNASHSQQLLPQNYDVDDDDDDEDEAIEFVIV